MLLSLVDRATREASSFFAATVALFAFPANGITPAPQTAATAGPDAFSQADTNQDGNLSRDEASDFLVIEIFISRDANHDGRMTLEEWVGGDPDRSADFKKRDANHDGIVTMDGSDHLWARTRRREPDHAGSGHESRRRPQSRRNEGLLREPRRPGEVGDCAILRVARVCGSRAGADALASRTSASRGKALHRDRKAIVSAGAATPERRRFPREVAHAPPEVAARHHATIPGL